MKNLYVECYNGYRGEETPRRFRLGQHFVVIHQIIDRWLSPDYRYFKVLGDDKSIYILRHDYHTHQWELTFYQKIILD